MFKHVVFLGTLALGLAGIAGCNCCCSDSCCLFHHEEPMYKPGECENCYGNNCAQGCKFRQVCGQNPFNERFCECIENCCAMPWNWFRHCGEDRHDDIHHVGPGASDGGLGLTSNCPTCGH